MHYQQNHPDPASTTDDLAETGQHTSADTVAFRTSRTVCRNAMTPLLSVAGGIQHGVSPLQFMDCIHAGSRQLGNRTFLRWVSELHAVKLKPDSREISATNHLNPHHSLIDAVPLQFGPKSRSKKQSRGQATGKSAMPPVKKKLDETGKELFECCYNGNAARLKRLLKHGHFYINVPNQEGTMLGAAVYFGHVAVIKALLSVPGIDVNMLQQGGYTPLYVAVDKQREDVVRLLLADCRVDVNLGVPGRYTPLHNAVEGKNVEIIRLLLANPGINANARKPNGATPLLIAAQNNLPGIVELLLERGADVNLGLTTVNSFPLLISAMDNHLEVARLLLQQADIRVNEKTTDGLTALCGAAQEGHEEVVRLLLEKGADPDISTNDGTSPLHLACLYRHSAVLAMLLEAGADINPAVSLAGGKFTVFEIARLVGDRDLISMVKQHLEDQPVWSTPPTTPPPQWSTPPSTPPPDWFAGSPSIPSPESSATLPHAEAVQPTPAPTPVLPGADTATMKPPDTKPASGAAERSMSALPVNRSAQAEAPSPLPAAKHALIAEVLKKLDNQTLDPAEGIWLMADVRNAANIDKTVRDLQPAGRHGAGTKAHPATQVVAT